MLIESLDVPSEIGCTTIPNCSPDDNTCVGVLPTESLPTNCVISLTSDESCNNLVGTIDGGDTGEFLSPFSILR